MSLSTKRKRSVMGLSLKFKAEVIGEDLTGDEVILILFQDDSALCVSVKDGNFVVDQEFLPPVFQNLREDACAAVRENKVVPPIGVADEDKVVESDFSIPQIHLGERLTVQYQVRMWFMSLGVERTWTSPFLVDDAHVTTRGDIRERKVTL